MLNQGKSGYTREVYTPILPACYRQITIQVSLSIRRVCLINSAPIGKLHIHVCYLSSNNLQGLFFFAFGFLSRTGLSRINVPLTILD